MTEKFSRWDVVDYLKSDEDMALYLDACIVEDPGDGSLVCTGLGDIARAKGMSQLARDTGLAREGLYKVLSSTQRIKRQSACAACGARPVLLQSWAWFISAAHADEALKCMDACR